MKWKIITADLKAETSDEQNTNKKKRPQNQHFHGFNALAVGE